MPLSTNDKTNETAAAAVAQFHKVFGDHPGLRPNHTKGTLLSGTFKPTDEVKELTTAVHFNQESTPVTVRLSNSTGLPNIPDTDPNGDPRGFSIRFHLGEHKHTDIVAHSTPFFPVNNGEDFVKFLQAVVGGTVPDFLGSHPAALAFVQAPKPTPRSFATQAFFGVNAFKFTDKDGKETYFRYRIEPELGVHTLTADEVKDKSPNFLFDEIHDRVKTGPISYNLLAQIAAPEDQTNDVTVHWPDSREVKKLGTITIDKAIENDAELQRTTIFDPIPRVAGLDSSDDPLLDFRASTYLISGHERRPPRGHA